MAISGHKTRSVFDRYDIVNEHDIFSAKERLISGPKEMAQDLAYRPETAGRS